MVEIILDYVGGPDIITGEFIREWWGSQSQKTQVAVEAEVRERQI